MRIFISYSRQNDDWAERFELLLKPLVHDGLVTLWRDERIAPGAHWLAEIERGLAETDAALLLVSKRFLASDFVRQKELPLLMERHRRGQLQLFCVLLERCSVQSSLLQNVQFLHPHDPPLSRLDPQALEDTLDDIVDAIRDAAQDDASAGGQAVDTKLLPRSAGAFVGRADDLRALDAALSDDKIRIATLEAWGGVGKSALVQGWLSQLVVDEGGYRGLSHVYGYSFYNQGLEGGGSSEDFFTRAFAFFGAQMPKSFEDRGRALAARVLAARMLLILDGLEPLQRPSDGKLQDPAMRALLVALADGRPGPGLCLITTRLRVPALDPRVDATVRHRQLDHLSEADGVELLRVLGVTGHAHDMKTAVAHAKGHALTIKLVGQYANEVLDGDVGRPEAVDLLDPEAPEGEHATKVLDAYDAWLGDTPERAIVRMMGLFDRPADADCLDALRAEPAIEGLTDALMDLPTRSWKRALTRLRRIGLLLDGEDGTLDAHPLVRAHAAARLAREAHAAWQAGHLRLYKYLTTSTTEEQPDTKEGLMPLYQAVVHGCRAGQVQETYDSVYRKRIHRGDEHYSWKKLGLFGSELTAVSSFFAEAFTRPHGSLRASDQAWLLNQAGIVLRALGRLAEAEAPMRTSFERLADAEEWKRAAVVAGNLSELNVTLGVLSQALADAERSVALADRSGDAFQRTGKRTTLADAHHQLGAVSSASSCFAKAEVMQAERQPSYPRLYSVQGYRYCDLLLSPGDASSARAVVEREEKTLRSAIEDGDPLLDVAVAYLSLGRAWTILAHGDDPDASEPARTHLDQAVEGLRASGQEDELPHGLLARAVYSRLVTHDANAAGDDLRDVEELADRCGMRLFACDAHLERARLLRDLSKADDARERAQVHVEAAKMLIEATGYHRRDGELANLEAWLRGEDPPHDLGAWS